MREATKKLTLHMFKISAIVLLVVSVACAALFYRLQKSPIQLDPKSPWVASMLDMGSEYVQLEKMAVFFDGSLKVRGSWAKWMGDSGDVYLSADEVTFSVSNRNLIRGYLVAKDIDIKGLSLNAEILPEYIVIAGHSFPLKKERPVDEDVDNEIQQPSGKGVVAFLNTASQNNRYFSALESVNVEDADVVFKDRIRLREWTMENGSLSFNKSFVDGESLVLKGDFRINKEERITPAQLSITHKPLQNYLNIHMKVDDVDSSYANGYMPFSNPFTGRGEVQIYTKFLPTNKFTDTRLSLKLGKGSAHISSAYEFPFVYDSATVDAYFHKKGDYHHLDIYKLELMDNKGVSLSGKGRVEKVLSKEPVFDLTLNAGGDATVQKIATYLPDRLISGAVNWLNDHFTESKIQNLQLTYTGNPYDLPFCEASCGFNGRFDFTDTRLKFLPNTPEAVIPAGSFVMKEGVIRVTAPALSIGGHDVTNADVAITNHFVEGKDARITIKGDAEGSLPELIDVLQVELAGEKVVDFDISGTHSSAVNVGFSLENPVLETMSMDIQSTATDVTVSGLIPDLRINAENLAVQVDAKQLSLSGRAKLNGYDASIQWWEQLEQFGKSTKVEVAGHVPEAELSSVLDATGVELTGNTPAVVKVSQSKSNKDVYTFSVEADLKENTLAFPELQWSKPVGVPLLLNGRGDVHVKSGLFKFDSLALKSDDVDVLGKIVVPQDRSKITADFSRLQLAKNNITLAYADGKVRIGGKVLDLAHMDFANSESSSDTESMSKPAVKDGSQTVDIDVAVDQILLKDSELLNAKSVVSRGANGDALETLEGQFPNGATFRAEDRTVNGERSLVVKSSDAGDALRALGFTDKIHKGNLDINLTLNTDENGLTTGTGVIDIQKANVKNAPFLMSLLSLLSLEQLIKNEAGVYFEYIRIPVRFEGDTIHLLDVVMKGPSIGISLDGSLNSKTSVINAKGQLVPFRGVNSLISKIPLLGDLLTGSQDGVLVADFKVSGPVKDPKVSTNPFSVVTPGILKDVFRAIIP